jgi:DNA-binding transcriptional LysR family regulator
MALDWDKLRIFHHVAEAGSFTHAGDSLNLSQSAVSRQVGALEDQLGVILFHRHARGLMLTEQGELLHATTNDVFGKLALIEGQLTDSRDKPEGPLTITTTEFVGTHWLAPLLPKFQHQYPDIQLDLTLDDRVLNLGLREADVALRLFQPNQPDLIQRHLANIGFGIYAAPNYLARAGTPEKITDLKKHTLITFTDAGTAPYEDANWILHDHAAGPILTTNTVSAMHGLAVAGAGIAVLPHYLAGKSLVHILPNLTPPAVSMFFVYPDVRRHSRRIEIFRDFLLSSIQNSAI